jgi:hypothetical protein
MTDLGAARWRKSSRSNGANGACVEVAFGPATTGVRDSKNPGDGMLVFGAASWCAFAAGVKSGRFDGRDRNAGNAGRQLLGDAGGN